MRQGFDLPSGEWLLEGGEVNRTAGGRDHVLNRRASGYKRGGGIAREEWWSQRMRSRSYANAVVVPRKSVQSDSLELNLILLNSITIAKDRRHAYISVFHVSNCLIVENNRNAHMDTEIIFLDARRLKRSFHDLKSRNSTMSQRV